MEPWIRCLLVGSNVDPAGVTSTGFAVVTSFNQRISVVGKATNTTFKPATTADLNVTRRYPTAVCLLPFLFKYLDM